MQQDGDELHADVEEARGASTPNVVRWVLTISLLAAVVLLTAIWVVGAWSSDQGTQTASARIRQEQNQASGGNANNTGVLGQNADQMNGPTPGENTEPLNMPNKNATKGQ